MDSIAERIRGLIRHNPDLTARQIAERLGSTPKYVRQCADAAGLRPHTRGKTGSINSFADLMATIEGLQLRTMALEQSLRDAESPSWVIRRYQSLMMMIG